MAKTFFEKLNEYKEEKSKPKQSKSKKVTSEKEETKASS